MKFKILIHAGQFVDEGMLHKGVYSSRIPLLHSEQTTMTDLIRQAKQISIFPPFNDTEYFNCYLNNILDCDLVVYELLAAAIS